LRGPKGNLYSAKSVENILNKAAKKTEIFKRVSPHMLRNSFVSGRRSGTYLRRELILGKFKF